MSSALAAVNLPFILGIILIVLFLGVFLILWSFFNVWFRAYLAGAPVNMLTLVAMRLRSVPYSMIVDARITAVKAGIAINISQFETHYLAGGEVIQTTQVLINAKKAGLELSWDAACAIENPSGTGSTLPAGASAYSA